MWIDDLSVLAQLVTTIQGGSDGITFILDT